MYCCQMPFILRHLFSLVLPLTILSIVPSAGQVPANVNARLEDLSSRAHEAQSRGDYRSAARRYREILNLRPDLAEVRANLGLMQHLLGEYDEAIRTFEETIRQKPGLLVPNLFLGLDLLKLHQAKQALGPLQRAEQLNPRDQQVALGLAEAYVALREFQKANEWYLRAVEISPNNAEAWYGLGVSYLNLQQSAVQQLGKINLDSSYFRVLLAESIEHQGRLDDVVKLYRELLKSQPAPPCLRGALGFVYVRQGNLSAAKQAFEEELQGGSGCLLARLGLARISVERGDLATVLREANAVWDRDRGFLEANAPFLWVGFGPEKADNLEERLRHLQADPTQGPLVSILIAAIDRWRREPLETFAKDSEALTSHTPGDRAFLQTGSSPSRLADEGHYSQCVQDLKPRLAELTASELLLLAQCSYYAGYYRNTFLASGKLLDASPENLSALFWRAKSSEKLAVDALFRAGLADPGSYRVHVLLAEAYRERHYLKEADAEYLKAIQLKDDDPAAHLGLARMYFDDFKLDEAVPELRKVLERNPLDPEASYFMAEILVYRRQYSDAAPYLRNGLNGAPDIVPRVHALLAKVYATDGRTTEAAAELKQALSADYDGSYHYQLYLLLRKLGDQGAATAALQKSEALRKARIAKQRALLEASP